MRKLYILKVSLSHSKKIWRKIGILSDQTLDNLHQAIFVAFDRFDPHLYSFYLTPPGSRSKTRFADAPEYTHPYNFNKSPTIVNLIVRRKKKHDAAKTKISALQLKEKDKFEYIFDFGDQWCHEITVEKIVDEFEKGSYPKVLEKKGDSPPQYPE